MKHYIDKDAVVTKLEELYDLEYGNTSNISCGKKIMLRNILLFLDTLEVKEGGDNSLEKFKSLQHLNKDLNKTLED